MYFLVLYDLYMIYMYQNLISDAFYLSRNYLDYVEESVADWTKEEEAKYQAHQLSKEIQRMREEEEMASRAAEKKTKGSAKRGSSKL